MAREGYPRMAISACYGGPLFNLLLGIGIPFSIISVQNRGPIAFDVSDIELVLIASLFCSLLSALIILPIRRFQVERAFGIYLLVLYLLFLTIAILVEVKIITFSLWPESCLVFTKAGNNVQKLELEQRWLGFILCDNYFSFQQFLTHFPIFCLLYASNFVKRQLIILNTVYNSYDERLLLITFLLKKIQNTNFHITQCLDINVIFEGISLPEVREMRQLNQL